MFLNISFDFVHGWNAQLAELIEQPTDLAEFAQINRFTVFRLSIEKFSFERIYGKYQLVENKAYSFGVKQTVSVLCTKLSAPSLVPRPRFPTAAGGLHHRYTFHVAVMSSTRSCWESGSG